MTLSQSSAARSFAITILLPALCIAAVQFLFVCVAMSPGSVRELTDSLGKWDGYWYMNIAQHGYHSPVPPVGQRAEISNVAFFPGYPFVVRLMHVLTGADYRIALILAAWIAAAGFWTYFLLLCRQWDIPRGRTALGAFAILAYPGSYFLAVGHSESLFLFFLLGYLYWTERDRWLPAAAHGFGAAAARLVGMAAALYPATALREHHTRAFPVRRIALVSVSALGSLSFFIYCQLRFGAWDLYMQTEKIGWGLVPRPLAIFDPTLYRIAGMPLWRGNDIDAVAWNRFSIPFFGALLLTVTITAIVMALRKKRDADAVTGGLLLLSWLLFAIPLSRPENFLRFGLPVFVLQVLLCMRLYPRQKRLPAWLLLPLLILSVAPLALQAVMAWRFGRDMPI